VAINAGEKDSVIKKFLKQHDFPYIILKDADRVISKSLGVEDLPRTVVISSDKKIVFDGNRPPATLP
jgi:capsule polysaccharide export protein KpsC/LpsZ